MERIWDHIYDNKAYIATGAGALAVSMWLFSKFRKQDRVCGVDYPKDTVILYGAPSNKYIPNLGHFVMKLETYLRINKIPYKTYFVYRQGPKKKVPWIEYNGVTMGDSQLIIEYLNKKFNVDMNKHLTKQQRAHAWAIQKWIEEFTYWLTMYSRWYLLVNGMLDTVLELSPMRRFFLNFMGLNSVKTMLYAVGVGRHSYQEVCDMIVNDLQQFSEILGSNKYVMGDTITEVDCAAFGILSEMRWSTPHLSCPGYKLLTGGNLQNVTDYLDRIKQTYWTDWDELCLNKSTRM